MAASDKPAVLVTGGAGYIGAHACKVLRSHGYLPVTFDNLSTGWASAVRFGPLIEADLCDRAALDAAFAEHRPVAVMHFAAFSQVGESVGNPGKYWRNNVLGSLTLFEAAIAAGCLDVVFSSTCATYGDQDGVLLSEDSAQHPINAYGSSKRAVEEILRDFATSDGLRSVIFRYFNVAGADPDGEIGEDHQPETHLIPVMLEAIDGTRPEIVVFGTDYSTPDGTCIRDYVHVMDLAAAHVKALTYLRQGGATVTLNCGYGQGFSVREVAARVRLAAGHDFPVSEGPRRPGDAPQLVAAADRIRRTLGWTPRYQDLDLIVRTTLAWEKQPRY